MKIPPLLPLALLVSIAGCAVEPNDDDAIDSELSTSGCAISASRQAAFDRAIALARRRETFLASTRVNDAERGYVCNGEGTERVPELPAIVAEVRTATDSCSVLATRFARDSSAAPLREALGRNLDFRAIVAGIDTSAAPAGTTRYAGLEDALPGAELYAYYPAFALLGPGGYLRLGVPGRGELRTLAAAGGTPTWVTRPITWSVSRSESSVRLLVTDGAKTTPYEVTAANQGGRALFVLTPDEPTLPPLSSLPPACPPINR